VHLPPLRERREDLPVLLDHFLDGAARSLGKRRPTPPDELHKLLAAYHFPGNVRELESLVFNAVSLHSAGKLSMDAFKSEIFRRQPDLAGETPEAEPVVPGRVAFHETLPTLRQIEAALVEEALCRSGGNQAIAATMLGITRQALNKRLNKPAGRE